MTTCRLLLVRTLLFVSAIACRPADPIGPGEIAVPIHAQKFDLGCDPGMENFCYRPMNEVEMTFAGPQLFEIMSLTPSIGTMDCINLAIDAIEYSFSGASVVWDSLEVMNPQGWQAITFGDGSSKFGRTGAPEPVLHIHEAVHRQQHRAGRAMDEAEAYSVDLGCMSMSGMSLRELPKTIRLGEGMLTGRNQ